MADSEREAVRRFSAVLARWGYGGDADVPAYMMFSLLEGAVHGHVLSQRLVSDEAFIQGVVAVLLGVYARCATPQPRPARPAARRHRARKA